MEHTARIVLASASPRRRRLFGWLGVSFEISSVDTPESLEGPLAHDPAALALSLAGEKSAASREASLDRDALVFTFDTLVALGDEVLGKPADPDDAWRMLRSLSGRTHQVHTGCCISRPGVSEPHSFSVTTDVTMHDLDDARIREWMASGEYLGCAGAYNIEGQVASVTVEQCYQNVAGMPLCHLYAALQDPLIAEHLPPGLRSPIAPCDRALARTCVLGPRITDSE